MNKFISPNNEHRSVKFIQDVDLAIFVMRDAGERLLESGKNPSKWWQLENLNQKFLFHYAKPKEFYVVLVNGCPAAASILQFNQNSQDWKNVDKNQPQSALYIHWLCVHRQFVGTGLPNKIIDFAGQLAEERKIKLLRVDTNADETKLRKIYENLGFRLVSIQQENYRRTAFYQKAIT